MNLEVKITREVQIEEVNDLIWGTGALSWSWWGDVSQEGSIYVFTHDGPNSKEGAHDQRTTVSAAGIVGAASLWLSERAMAGGLNGDIRDAITDNLGYLDAADADSILQRAVLKDVVFG